MNIDFLERHLASHPAMKARDALKLCYQSTFGCEHLMADPDSMLRHLREELSSVKTNGHIPLYDPICGGYARLNLSAPNAGGLSPETILRMMRLSALGTPRTIEDFLNACNMVSSVISAGHAPFSSEEFDEELKRFLNSGCQPVHHSEAYRQAYDPAYRVIRSDWAVLLPLLKRLESSPEWVVFLDGPCGSGKSTLASLLSAYYDTVPISMDDFFLPTELRTPERLQKSGGNIHWERFVEEIVPELKKREDFTYRRYRCQNATFSEVFHIHTPITIIEGSYSHHPEIRKACEGLNALYVYLAVNEGEQLERLQKRNPDRFFTFQNRWMPLEKIYFEAYDVKRQADLVLKSLPWEA